MSSQALTDIGEMKTFFTGDVSGLEKASQQAPQIVSRATQQINQVLASPAAGFDNLARASEQSSNAVVASVSKMGASVQGVAGEFGKVGSSAATNFGTVNTAATSSLQYINQWGDGISTSVRKFTSELEVVPPAFASVGTSAQAGAATASSALNSVSTSAKSIGSTVSQSSTQAAAGLQTLSNGAQAAGGSVNTLAAQVTANNKVINSYTHEIALARVELSQLAQKIQEANAAGQGSVAQTQALRTQYAQLSTTTRGLVAEKGLLVNENRNLNTSMTQTGGTVTKTSGLMGVLGGLMATNTTQISSQGTAWQGYDAQIQAIVRSLGGVPVIWALLISVGGQLIGKLFEKKEKTKEAAAASEELIKSDAALAQIFTQMSAALQGANADIEKQAELFKSLLRADITASITQYTKALVESEAAANKAGQAQARLEALSGQLALSQTTLIQREHELVAATEAATAAGVQSTFQRDLAIQRVTTEQQHLRGLEAEQRRATSAIEDDVAKRTEAEQKARTHLDAILAFKNATGLTTTEVIAMGRAVLGAGKDFDLFAEKVRIATSTQYEFNKAIRDFKAPGLDVAATTEAIAKSQASLISRISELKAAGQDEAQILGLISDALEKYVDQLKNRIALDAADRKQVLSSVQAQAILKQALADSGTEIARYAQMLGLADKNMDAFTEKAKKAKLTISEISPLITERAIAGSPEAVKTVVDRYVDTIVNRLNENKDRVGEVGTSVAALFIQRFESSLGKDKKTKFFDSIIDELRLSLPELDAEMTKVVSLLRKGAEELGVTFGGTGLEFEQMNRSIIDSLRRQVGITDDMWKRMSASQKEALDEGFRDAASVFLNQLEQLEIKVKATANELQKAAEKEAEASKRIFDAWVAGTITTSEAIFQMGGVVHKAMDEIVADYFKVETAVVSLAEQTDLQLKKISDSLENNFIFQQDRFESESRDAIESVISFYERLAEQLGLTGDAYDQFVNQKVRTVMSEMKDINKETVDAVIKQHERLKVKLPGIWDEVFKDASASTRKNVDDILGIIDLIPGRTGDALRKTESEFRRWYEMIDRTIRLIERALGESKTEGLGGILNSIVDLFKDNTSKIEAVLDHVYGPVVKSATDAITGLGKEGTGAGAGIGDAFKVAASAVGSFATGLAIAAASAGSLKSEIIGVVAAAAAGFAQGGPIGAAIAAFAAGFKSESKVLRFATGGLVSLFFGGPSEEEKEAQKRAEEAQKLQLEQVKQQLARGYQELQQAVLETASRASALLESIIGRARVPVSEIKGFVKDMTRLLRMLVKELATIPKEVTEEIRVIAENLGPAADLMAAMPEVFDGINQHMPMAESQARLYINDWALLTNLIGELAEETPNKLEKQIKKFSDRLMPAAELLITVSEGMQAVFKTRPVSAAQFQNWATSIDIVIVEIGKLEEKFDRYGVRKAAVFAEQATKTFTLLTEGSAAINSVGDIAIITASDLAPFSSGINLIITTVADLSRTVNSQLVADAQRFSQGAGASVTFMLETAQGFQELKDIETVIPDTLRSVGEGIKLAIVILAQVANEVDQEMRDDAEQLSVSIGSVFTVITSAAQAFTAASTTRTLFPATMRAIGDGIRLAIVELSHVSRSVDSEMVAEANAFAVSVGEVVNVIGTAGQAMRDLEPERFNVNGLVMLIGNIEEATRRTITLAKSIDKSDLALAVEFALNAQKIFEATAAGISIQKDMANLEPISISQWDNWVLNVSQQTTALARAVDLTHEGMLLSAEFRSNTDVIRENVIGALSNILATANAAAGYLSGSANFNSLIAPSGLSASTLAPSAPFAPASAPLSSSQGSGNTYYVNVNNYGHVLDETRFRESVREVIRDEDRTSTVFLR